MAKILILEDEIVLSETLVSGLKEKAKRPRAKDFIVKTEFNLGGIVEKIKKNLEISSNAETERERERERERDDKNKEFWRSYWS